MTTKSLSNSQDNEKTFNLEKLYVLVLTIPKGKKEVMTDLLESFDVTATFSVLGRSILEKEKTREIVFAIIRKGQVKDAMLAIEDKFASFGRKVCMAYTIPLDRMIGVQNYMFLSNGGK